jgi:RNA-directed DNA polymerase
MTSAPPPKTRQELYERIARGGRDAVTLEEMIRLGFWSADAPMAGDPDGTARLVELRRRLDALRVRANQLTDMARVAAEQRAARMAASRARRTETKQRRLAQREAAKAQTAEREAHAVAYLGAGVSVGLGPTADRRVSDAAALGRDQLPVLHDAAAVAAALQLSLGALRFLAYSREVSTVTQYRRFSIAKKTGGVRVISAPRARLKAAQHWILGHILDRVALAEPAHGFRAGRSIVSNAAPHVGAALVINVDLRDFFPTVTYRRVRGLFRKLGYGEEVATVLALLCSEPETTTASLDGVTYYVARGERHLPQGAPTSPAITNLLCRRLDARLAGFARKHGFTYTRYADDLTLSARDPGADIGAALAVLHKVARAEGWEVHPDKVRVQRQGSRQEVTGVIVNERLGVDRRVLRRFRALLHQIGKTGPAGKHWNGNPDVLGAAAGFASFVRMVDPTRGAALQAEVAALRARHP